MFPDHTAFERVHLAVCQLASSAAPLQTRLERAGLHIVVLRVLDFRAGEERDLYGRIMSALTRTGPLIEDLGTLQTSTGIMSDAEAEATAKDILALYNGLFF